MCCSRVFIGLVAFVASMGIWIGRAYEITAQTGGAVGISQATLFHAEGSEAFNSVVMFDDGAHGDGEAGDGVYGAEIPSYPAGSLVNYMFSYQIAVPVGEESPADVVVADPVLDRIVINEFMASNTTTIQDAQEDFDD